MGEKRSKLDLRSLLCVTRRDLNVAQEMQVRGSSWEEKRSGHKSRRWEILEGTEEISKLMIRNCKQDKSYFSGD